MSKLHPSTRSIAVAALIFAVAAFVAAMIGVAGGAPTRIIVRKGDIEPGAVTARALAKGAVTAPKIRKQAVTGPKLAKEAIHSTNLASESVNRRVLKAKAVGTAALADDAVTSVQLAPGSVYGGALGAETVQTKAIADLDGVEHNGEWTASNSESALCGPGEGLLGSGFVFTNPGNRQAAWLQALPFANGETKGVTGRITTDSGGTATAQVAALCLK